MTQTWVRTWAGLGKDLEETGFPGAVTVHWQKGWAPLLPYKPLTNTNKAQSLLLWSDTCVSNMLGWYRWSTQLHKPWSKVNLLSRCWKKRARSCLLGDIQAQHSFEKHSYFFRPSKLFLDIAGWAVLSVLLLSFPHLSKGLKLKTVSFNNSIHHVCKKFLFLQDQTAVHLFK